MGSYRTKHKGNEMKFLIQKGISESIRIKEEILKYSDIIDKIAKTILNVYRNGAKAIFFGNGGSVADAQHIVAELVARFYLNRRSLPVVALTTNTSILIAFGDDFSFAEILAKQLEGTGIEGDITIGISTSGDPQNVVEALQLAKQKGLFTVGFTGKSGGKMKDIVDLCLCIPSDDTARIQEAHIMMGHIMCEIVESELFSDNYNRGE